MVQLSSTLQRNRRLVEAKQRASVQWLLSKAYGHQVPEDIKEPFYRDLEDQEYLKPAVVHALANAELYCLALAHIYADPNYSQLNHWGVIQALARKGIYVAEPSDVALTETTLIHTSPLRMSAHMAVMEGIMGLFVKEIVSAERVVSAVRKFAELGGGSGTADPPAPKDAEQAMLLWINKSCAALKKRLQDESEAHGENVPNFGELRQLADLGDGVSLVGLLSFYCAEFMDWTRVASNEPLSMADCLYNLQLVRNFCLEHLPYNVCHLSLEDLVYMHSSVRQNVLALLADLFYLLEIRPAKCVRPPVLMRDRFNLTSATHTEGGKTTTTVTVRRQGSLQERDRSKRQTIHEATAGSTPRRWDRSEAPTPSPSPSAGESRHGDEFIVHRGKTVPTLHHVAGADGATPRLRAKEKFNTDTKAEERGEDQPPAGRSSAHGPAGVPSNWEERKQTYAGRRSRRNSITDDSHLTIENFGGSQDNLSLLGRNPDKEPVALSHVGRRPSVDSGSHYGDMPTAGTPSGISSTAGANYWKRNNERTRSQENLSDLMFVDNRDVEEQERRCSRASSPYSSISSGNNTSKSNGGGNNKSIVIIASNPAEAADLYDPHDASKLVKATNFAELSKLRESLGSSAINIVYMQQDKESTVQVRSAATAGPNQRLRGSSAGASDGRKGGGLSIAEATSWDPQVPDGGSLEPLESPAVDTAEMYSIRLQMEEKRKRIEAEKRHQELMASRQREKVGKAAFLQAVAKGKGSGSGSGTDSPTADYTRSMMPDGMDSPARAPSYHQPPQHLSAPDPADGPQHAAAHLADYHQHVDYGNSVMSLGSHHPSHPSHPAGHPAHPHMASPYDPYRPVNGMTPEPSGQPFYMHQPSPGRRTWGQPQPISPAPPPPMSYAPDGSMGPYGTPVRRAQWGTPQPVRPMMQMGHGGYLVSSPASFVDPHMQQQQQQAYTMTPPRHPADPYDPSAHFYANGSQFQPPTPQEEAYFYPQARPFSLQPQPPPVQTPPHPHPQHLPLQQQQQPQSYVPSPGGGSSPSYPSMADQRAPFRLHSAEPDPSKASGPKNLVQQVQSPQGPPVREPPVREPPVDVRKSTHSTSGRSGSNGVSAGGSSSGVLHAAMPTPSIDDMEPQNVSFIETPGGADEADEIPRRLRNLNITSGNRTYRIPHGEGHSSPPRPALIKTFRLSQSPVSSAPKSPSPVHGHYTPDYAEADRDSPEESSQSSQSDPSLGADLKTAKLKDNVDSDRGFIITFDDDGTAPKRPKPQLGVKRLSQLSPSKKPSAGSASPSGDHHHEQQQQQQQQKQQANPQPLSNNNKMNDARFAREESPRRSLSSMAREIRADDYSPFTPDSGFGGGHNSQEELKLFHAATSAPLGSASAANRSHDRSHDRDSSQDEEVAALIIGDETSLDPETLDEMERKKERILMQSLRRKQQQEEQRQRKEMEAVRRKEEERSKEEEKSRKKEEEKQRRAIILEQYKIKKAMEEAEKEGRVFEMPEQMGSAASKSAGPKMRNKNNGSATTGRPRPKTIHISSDSGADLARASSALAASRGKRGSGTNLTDSKTELRSGGSNSATRGSNPTLNRRGSNSSLHAESLAPSRYRTIERGHTGRKDHSVPRIGQSGGSVRSSREDLYGGGGSRAGGFRGSNSSLNDADSYEAFHTTLVHSGRKGSGFMTDADAAGRSTPAAPNSRRAPSPALTPTSPATHSTPLRRLPSPSGPGSLPPGLVGKRGSSRGGGGFDDGASDVSSGAADFYGGPRLYKQPAARSNRSIILNAVEYCVFPGVVNRDAKQRVLEEITRSESKNFLILFRDGQCMFRALYSYHAEREEIVKLYGTGPKQITDNMFEKFFKYNSGGKCFSQVHTKHLTVTIDAFTIHASLWQGKKASLPNRKDMTLVI